MAIDTGEIYAPFPYLGSQVLVASERIHLHARKDSVLVTARKSISLSSLGSLNVDCNKYVAINSPRIDLGLNADQQVILGTLFINELRNFLLQIQTAGSELAAVGESKIADAMTKVGVAGKQIKESSQRLSEKLDGMLSKNTYTV